MIKKIFNFQFSIFNGKSGAGFTLIELLAVVIVLFNTIRGTRNTSATDRVSTSGSFAIDNISRDLKFAYGFFGISQNGVDFDKDICSVPLSPTPTPAPTPDFSSYKYIKIYDQDRNAISYSCNGGFYKITPTDTLSLINENDLIVTSCNFSCSQDFPTDPPSIGISFTIQDKSSSKSASFQTSVTMRNINK